MIIIKPYEARVFLLDKVGSIVAIYSNELRCAIDLPNFFKVKNLSRTYRFLVCQRKYSGQPTKFIKSL